MPWNCHILKHLDLLWNKLTLQRENIVSVSLLTGQGETITIFRHHNKMHIGHKTPQQFFCLTLGQNFYSKRSYPKWCNTILCSSRVLQLYANRPVLRGYHPILLSHAQSPEHKWSPQIHTYYNNTGLHNMPFMLRQCFRGFSESMLA